MSEKAALVAIHQSLRKSFQVVEQQQETWTNTLPGCSPLLDSLSNVAEQLQACEKVMLENTPLAQYPDLQPRLRHKLVSAMELILEKLTEKMSDLQKVRDSVSHQVWAVFQVYEQQAGALGVQACLEGTAVHPSIADMLEWLQDIENHYRCEYLRRKLLLQVREDNLSAIRELPQSWQALTDRSQPDLVPDTLLKVSFFREAE
ncbi:AFG2-interacting ribosome maturation factor [Ambystoma mexicanum]|uniref:AFG2-interacting ribosome maturation factor n=1 Tax=Ambystoma mexicanum TaxID=8296 RepID=UPI0037E7B5DE